MSDTDYRSKYLQLGAEYLNILYEYNLQKLYSIACEEFRREGFVPCRNQKGEHAIKEVYRWDMS